MSGIISSVLSRPLSDALTGVIAGALATVLMMAFEIPFWKNWGMDGVLEWQVNWAIVSKLSGKRFSQSEKPGLIWALSAHIGHGALAGLVFNLILPFFNPVPGDNIFVIREALAYSILLWLIFSVAPRRLFESSGLMVSNSGLIIALGSHLVYGFFLGLLTLFL